MSGEEPDPRPIRIGIEKAYCLMAKTDMMSPSVSINWIAFPPSAAARANWKVSLVVQPAVDDLKLNTAVPRAVLWTL